LCGGDISFNRFGLCTRCLKKWTATGTYPIPDWLRTFSKEHNNLERKKMNGEIVFSSLADEVFDGAYTEPLYSVIEQKYHKVEKRGRPTKLQNSSKNIV